MSQDNPAVTRVLLRGAELLGEKAASERLNRRVFIGGVVVLVFWVCVMLRELAGLI